MRDGRPHYPWLDVASLDVPRVRRRLLACALREIADLPAARRSRDALRRATRDIVLRHGGAEAYPGVCTKWMQREFPRITLVARGWSSRPDKQVRVAVAARDVEIAGLKRRIAELESADRDRLERRGVAAMNEFRAAMGFG